MDVKEFFEKAKAICEHYSDEEQVELKELLSKLDDRYYGGKGI